MRLVVRLLEATKPAILANKALHLNDSPGSLKLHRIIAYSGIFLSLSFHAARAQDFPEIRNSEADAAATPMSPHEAAASMAVPDGFRVDVFASEPDVQNPIDMTWDARGRLWIAENYTYAERSQRFDLNLRDRVVILEDRDGDGVSDHRTVFTDQVQMLTSVEVGHGGVWLMCPPQLLFIPDADHDDRPDGPAQVVLDGFDVAKENYHNFANGLRWGPDGWLYGRCGGSCPGEIGLPGTPAENRLSLRGGIWRFHPVTSQVEVLTHGTTNPWGHDWNAHGECFFINTVNGHLWHMIPGAHFVRPFTLDPNPYVYELIDMHADHWHFDTDGNWTDSRDGAANAYGGGHAHVGMMIYLGDQWPVGYRERLLTFNIHGRRANQEILERHGSGYVGRHGKDLMLATDPFFRGMELSYGPDGAVYVADWSDTGECHEHTGVHRTSGRIFRVSYPDGGTLKPETLDLWSMTAEQLCRLIAHPNEWYVRQARIELAWRARQGEELDEAAAAELASQLASEESELAYRALVTGFVAGEMGKSDLRTLLRHPDEHIRAWTIRLLTDDWPLDDVFGPTAISRNQESRILEEYQELENDFRALANSDQSGLVRLTLASTLQRLPVSKRARLAASLMQNSQDADDHNLPLMVWYGLIPVAESDPHSVAQLATTCQWPKTQRLIVRRVAEQIKDDPDAVSIVLAHVSRTDDAVERLNLLSGMADGLRGFRQVAMPKGWEPISDSFANDPDDNLASLVRDLSVLFGDGRALEQVRDIVADTSADIGLRRSALETLVANGGPDVRDICLSMLNDQRLNVIAARGLAQSEGSEVAAELIKNYRRFRGPHRPKVIAILVSRPEFAAELLTAIEQDRIPVADLTAFDVRQIRSMGDGKLQRQVAEVWGDIRDTSEEKQLRIAQLREELSADVLASADLAKGRELFDQNCAKCHRLFGSGENIGPDLTGGNRTNLDYLLENMIDPSAVVSKDYRMSVIQTLDGQVLNGLIVTQNENTLTLQTQTDLIVINQDDVDESTLTNESPMPDGLLDNLSPRQVRNLMSYLMQPSQVPLPGSN